MASVSSDDSDAYQGLPEKKQKQRPGLRKRRKVNSGSIAVPQVASSSISLEPLLEIIGQDTAEDFRPSYDHVIGELLPEYLHVRAAYQERELEVDENGKRLRPLTRSEVSSHVEKYTESDSRLSATVNSVRRKLFLRQERRKALCDEPALDVLEHVTPLTSSSVPLPVNPQVINALNLIQTTPFENSFLSRLQGVSTAADTGVLAIDWETSTPWMNLMTDIRDHYRLSHPDRGQVAEARAPVAYTSLQTCHLDQVHDLLSRTFWAGINVGDSLDYSPEKCAVVATYKRLVVGVAILSSPQETYITYLAVKAGWDNAQIARSMLFHLITLNPHKDITLHVSANNSAMLLYNRFGFKAEEFVAGFYEDYLDPQSRQSKNAFRLRLRQQ